MRAPYPSSSLPRVQRYADLASVVTGSPADSSPAMCPRHGRRGMPFLREASQDAVRGIQNRLLGGACSPVQQSFDLGAIDPGLVSKADGNAGHVRVEPGSETDDRVGHPAGTGLGCLLAQASSRQQGYIPEPAELADGQQPLSGRLRRGQGLDVQIGDVPDINDQAPRSSAVRASCQRASGGTSRPMSPRRRDRWPGP